MKYQTFNKKPVGYILTIDGEVVEGAGKNGLIAKKENAERLRDILRSQMPDSCVDMFAWIR